MTTPWRATIMLSEGPVRSTDQRCWRGPGRSRHDLGAGPAGSQERIIGTQELGDGPKVGRHFWAGSLPGACWWPCFQMKVVAGIRLSQQDQGPPLWTKVTEDAWKHPLCQHLLLHLHPGSQLAEPHKKPVAREMCQGWGSSTIAQPVEGWSGSPETTAQTTSTVPPSATPLVHKPLTCLYVEPLSDDGS